MGLLIRFARQWVAGETMDDALRVAKEANRRGIQGIVNHLGEHYHEKPPVEATTQRSYGTFAPRPSSSIARSHIVPKESTRPLR
jgi:hypothetical protein